MIPARTFIADLKTGASHPTALAPRVCIEGWIIESAYIPGLLALQVRDGSIAPPLALRVPPQCKGYELNALPTLVGQKVRAMGRLRSNFNNSLVLVCDALELTPHSPH